MEATIEKYAQLTPNPDGTPINPFCHDFFHMGMEVGENLMMMMRNHVDEPCPYLIFVDQISGKRWKVVFKE